MKMKIKTVQMISNDCKDEMKNREDIKVGHAMRHATVPAVLRATHVELPMFQNDSIMHVGKIGLNAHLIKMFACKSLVPSAACLIVPQTSRFPVRATSVAKSSKRVAAARSSDCHRTAVSGERPAMLSRTACDGCL